MKKNEKILYRKNNLGYSLIMVFISLNVVYSIFVLNNMDVNWELGIFIFVTILLLLFGFLMASKMLVYSIRWSYIALGVAVFQLTRLFIGNYTFSSTQYFLLNLCIIASAISCFAGGLISIRRSLFRKQLLDASKNKQDILST
jgi:phosphatidylserine synthase